MRAALADRCARAVRAAQRRLDIVAVPPAADPAGRRPSHAGGRYESQRPACARIDSRRPAAPPAAAAAEPAAEGVSAAAAAAAGGGGTPAQEVLRPPPPLGHGVVPARSLKSVYSQRRAAPRRAAGVATAAAVDGPPQRRAIPLPAAAAAPLPAPPLPPPSPPTEWPAGPVSAKSLPRRAVYGSGGVEGAAEAGQI